MASAEDWCNMYYAELASRLTEEKRYTILRARYNQLLFLMKEMNPVMYDAIKETFENV